MPSQQNLKNGKEAKLITRRHALEIIFRISLVVIFTLLESARPFVRVVQPAELGLYRYPIAKVPFLRTFGGPVLNFLLTPLTMIAYTFLIILLNSRLRPTTGSAAEYLEALLVPTLSIPMTGIFVNVIKIGIGRPRPTFMERCYGTSHLKYSDASLPCTGEDWLVSDGRKSFPSGHTSLAFSCFGFLFLYTAGQLGTFREQGGRRYTAHLMLIPYLLAPMVVGVSRVSEYKHHWEDVLVGGIIGTVISYISYRIYFPSLTSDRSNVPYAMTDAYQLSNQARFSNDASVTNDPHKLHRKSEPVISVPSSITLRSIDSLPLGSFSKPGSEKLNLIHLPQT